MANPRTPERSCFDVALCRQLVPAALSFFLEENGSDLTQQAVYFVFRSEAGFRGVADLFQWHSIRVILRKMRKRGWRDRRTFSW
jgi:hypothetical protein